MHNIRAILKNRILLVLVVTAVSFPGVIQTCFGTTIKQIGFDQLIQSSVLVFEGEVIDRQTRVQEGSSKVVTDVRFRLWDVIKGDYSQSELVLTFDGGRSGRVNWVVAGMQYPEVGEKGIYFVSKNYRNAVNPLMGWQQGRFLIEEQADGTRSVKTGNGKPVFQIDPVSASSRIRAISRGVAAGITTQGGENRSAITPYDFKQQIRRRVAR